METEILTAKQANELTIIKEPERIADEQAFQDRCFYKLMKDIKQAALEGKRYVFIDLVSVSALARLSEATRQRFIDLGYTFTSCNHYEKNKLVRTEENKVINW